MHGVRKEAQSEEEAAAIAAKKAKKLAQFVHGRDIVLGKHGQGVYDTEGLTASEALLRGQPDVGTFWNYRRLCLQRLESELGEEEMRGRHEDDLRLTFDCLGKNPKSYGAWHHRGWVLGRMNKADWVGELKLVGKALEMDERNFHCWDHRRLVCRLAHISPQEELAFSHEKVKTNFSNYSAWHYRGSILPVLRPPPEGSRLPLEPSALKEELELAMNAFYTDPEDQAAWLYASSLLQESEPSGAPLIVARRWDEEAGRVLVLLDRVPEEPEALGPLVEPLGATAWEPLDSTAATGIVWTLSCGNEGPKDEAKISFYDEEKLRSLLRGSQPAEDIAVALRTQLEFREEIGAELKACHELASEEGGKNHWPTYIATLCMLRLQPLEIKYGEEVRANLRALGTMDAKRRGYYVALRDRLDIADAIHAQLGNECLHISDLEVETVAWTEAITVLFPQLRLPKSWESCELSFHPSLRIF